MEPIVGARYKSTISGDDLYYFKPSTYWNATKATNLHSLYHNEINFEKPVSGRVSSEVLTTGVSRCYGHTPVMGADPEFFLESASIPGFQKRRVPAFEVLEDKYATSTDLFWDGFQAESRVNPSVNHLTVVYNFSRQVAKLRPYRLRISPGAFWRIPDELLKNSGDAQVALGCDPSFNIYDTKGQCVPDARKLLWRFAGGHIHFSLTDWERNNAVYKRVVRTLDQILGVASVAMAEGYDVGLRRRYYGLAGEFRLPPHGLEYRTLSNWYWMHPQAALLVLDLARQAFNIGRAGLGRAIIGTPQQVQQIINFNDVKAARALCGLNRDFYNSWATREYGQSGTLWAAIMGGIKSVIPTFGQYPEEAYLKCEDPWHMPTWQQLGS